MSLIEKIKQRGVKNEVKKIITLHNFSENGFLLGFKKNNNEAFLIENPTLKNIEEITSLLNTEDSNFLYVESPSFNRIFVHRKDKSQFNNRLLTNNEILSVVVTSKNLVCTIIQRFVEDNMFDNRKNEKRYLLKKNWYNYALEDSEPYCTDPLYNLPLDIIGIWQAEQVVLQLYLNKTIDYSIPYFLENLKSDTLDLRV